MYPIIKNIHFEIVVHLRRGEDKNHMDQVERALNNKAAANLLKQEGNQSEYWKSENGLEGCEQRATTMRYHCFPDYS